MKYTIFDIAHIVDGTLLQSAIGYSEVEHLLLDSRQVLFPATALFFAVSGARHNAHLFIPQLYAEGVRTFIISEKIDLSACPEANFILVANTLEALQMLAAVSLTYYWHHRQQWQNHHQGVAFSVAPRSVSHRAQPAQLQFTVWRAALGLANPAGTQPRYF